jgi:hypothetical protein
MKNMLVGDIKPKDDEDNTQMINPSSSSRVPQDDDKNERVKNEDIHVSHEQAEAQAQDVDVPNLLLKWLIEDTHLYFKHIHKISS